VKVNVRHIAALNYLFIRLLGRIFLTPSKPSRALNEMTGAQKRILFFLDMEGPQRMSGIAALMGVSLPAATIVVDKLVATQLVKRSADPADRRVVRIALTRKGKKVINELKKFHEDRFREILKKLTAEEQVELITAFERIYDLLSRIDKR